MQVLTVAGVQTCLLPISGRENVPVPSLAKPTDPVGVVAPVAEVSVTVAVQTEPLLTVTDAGTQPTTVEERKSVVEGKSVDLGGRRIIKKKKGTKEPGIE